MESTPGNVPFNTVPFIGNANVNGVPVNRSNAGYKTLGGFVDSADDNNSGQIAYFGNVVSSDPTDPTGSLALGQPADYVVRGILMFDAGIAQNDPAKSTYALQDTPVAVLYEGTIQMQSWGKTQSGSIDPVLGCVPIFRATSSGTGSAAIGAIEFQPSGTAFADVPSGWAILPCYVVEVDQYIGVRLEVNFATDLVGTGDLTGGGSTGGIAFFDSSTDIASSAGFLWDNTGKLFTVSKNTHALSAGPTGKLVSISNADTVASLLVIDSYAAHSELVFRSADTTALAPSASQSGDNLGQISAIGYGATGFGSAASGLLKFLATENWTDTAHGLSLSFWTTPNTTATAIRAMTLDQTGFLGIGTIANAPVTVLQVANTGNAALRGITSSQYSTDTVAAQLNFRKGRGTQASPTTVVTGDVLGEIITAAYDGTSYIATSAAIDFISTGTIATGRVAGNIVFKTGTDVSTTVLTEAARFTEVQLLKFSSTALTNMGGTSTGYANDAAAAAATPPVPVGGLYHNAGVVQIRRT